MTSEYQQLRFMIVNTEYETISERLEAAGALAVSVIDAEDHPIYEPELNTFPVWEKAEIMALFDAAANLSEITQQLNIKAFKLEKVENKAWERVCMEQFQPMPIGTEEKLWICPSWHTIHKPNAVVVSLDPGLAFGTGTHATTKLCLEWLAAHDVQHKTLIDYGCGSGILSISALKLGAVAAYAVDIDPQALHAAQENAAKNNVLLHTLMPAQLPELQADVIIANILIHPLITLAPALIALLKPNGQLVLSGILTEQIDDIMQAYALNIKFDPAVSEDGWARLSGTRIAEKEGKT